MASYELKTILVVLNMVKILQDHDANHTGKTQHEQLLLHTKKSLWNIIHISWDYDVKHADKLLI